MNLRNLLFALFPVLLFVLLAAERVANVLLAFFPGEAALWRAWLLLRALFRPISHQLEALSGGSLFLQMAYLGAAGLLFVLPIFSVRRAAFGFLSNHMLLIVTLAMMTVAEGNWIAGLPVLGTELHLMLPANLNGVTTALLSVGTVACSYCHYCLFTEGRQARADLKRP